MILEVADSGVGIPQDELSRVFERFHRVPGAKGRAYEGTGIGLGLVRELVGLHGGEIEFPAPSVSARRSACRFQRASRTCRATPSCTKPLIRM